MTVDAERTRLDRYPVQVEIVTRYADLDAQEHVNNVAVAGYYQEARVLFHDGLPPGDRPAGSRTLVAHHAMDYLAEISYPGPVLAGVRVARIGRTSYTLHAALFRDGRCVGVATTVMVHAGAAGPTELPAGLRRYLERFGGSEDP